MVTADDQQKARVELFVTYTAVLQQMERQQEEIVRLRAGMLRRLVRDLPFAEVAVRLGITESRAREINAYAYRLEREARRTSGVEVRQDGDPCGDCGQPADRNGCHTEQFPYRPPTRPPGGWHPPKPEEEHRDDPAG